MAKNAHLTLSERIEIERALRDGASFKEIGNSAGTVTITREEYDSLMGFKAQNAELSQKLNWLLEQLRLSKKRQFGQSSEQTKFDIGEQLSLLFNEAEFFADETVQEPPFQEIQTHYRRKSKELKDRLSEDLPVDVVEHRLPEDERLCPACGTVDAGDWEGSSPHLGHCPGTGENP